ncbi:thioesterase II family protein [Micromonospora okii]|uniref:thioesterase II family protein n=1 Tax=Micromonospora okii TaxID=1182970 RepID=UPI001E55B134|nr:alpha/beta fold hydrolase [Micromonospora okii]
MTGATAVDLRAQRWLRRLNTPSPAPDGSLIRLVAFPHAGGAASFYSKWARLLPRGVELLAVQYPGRQDRAGEPCATTMSELVGPIVEALASVPGPELAVLGHSMGAAVAVEVARRIEQRDGRALARLFVSGRPAPHLQPAEDVHTGGDEALLADLRRLGGTEEELFSDASLREMVLPALRADYRLIETYQPDGEIVLDTPITALCGDSDPEVTPEQAEAWRRCTRGDFRHRVLPGDHFYLVERPVTTVREVLADLRPGTPVSMSWPSTP